MVRVQKKAYVSGLEGMIGEHGLAVTAIAPRGRVYIHGEYWDARAEEEIAEGCEIEVVKTESNLKLLVRAVPPVKTASVKEADNVSD